MLFKDKIVLVTGGSSGIGEAVARTFAAAGARVALSSRTLDHAEMEVQDRASVAAAVARVCNELGPPDILVNSAGVAGAAPSETLDEAEWDRIVDTNLKGTFLACQAVGRLMLERRAGAIVNLASVAGMAAFPKRAAYSASKAAVIMLTKVLAVEWADRGVRVNAIAPAVIRTAMNERMIAAGNLDLAAIERRTPMHRRGESCEVADAALFLASDAARYVTGSCLEVDGGWTSYGFL